jgi:putative hydrolase of the HAD superfamily
LTIKAITFDFWATLYQPKTVDYTQRILRLKETIETHSNNTFEVEQFQSAVKVARESWSQTWLEEYRTITASEWLEILLLHLPAVLPPPLFQEIEAGLENSIFQDPPALAPKIKTLLPNLAKAYKLGVISDTGLTPGRVLREILSNDGILEFFSCLTFSDEVGRSKPHARPFLTTLNRLGVLPQEAVHVGDLLRTDIAGAKHTGMRAVQYIGINHDKETSTPANILPDAVIKNHMELKPLLQNWESM